MMNLSEPICTMGLEVAVCGAPCVTPPAPAPPTHLIPPQPLVPKCQEGWSSDPTGDPCPQLRLGSPSLSPSTCPTHPVQLRVEPAGIAHGLTLCVAPPQGGGGRVAVGAAEAGTAGRGLWKGKASETRCWPPDSGLLG